SDAATEQCATMDQSISRCDRVLCQIAIVIITHRSCSLCAPSIGGNHLERPPLHRRHGHDAVTAMQFVVLVANGNAAGLNVGRDPIMRRTAICKGSSACISDKAAALIAEPAQNVPYAFRGPLRKWNTRAGDIGGSFVGGTG